MSDREIILVALRNAGGKIGKAAKSLGISRRTMQNRMRTVGLARGRSGRPKRKLSYGKKRVAWSIAGTATVGLIGFMLLRRQK